MSVFEHQSSMNTLSGKGAELVMFALANGVIGPEAARPWTTLRASGCAI